MGDHTLANAGSVSEGSRYKLIRDADAPCARDQLVEHEALDAAELAPGARDQFALLLLRQLSEREHASLYHRMQRFVKITVALRQQQRNRLGEVTHRVVALLEQPI